MTEQNSLVPIPAEPSLGYSAARTTAHPTHLARAMWALRGRLKWAIPLALVLATAGSFLGFRLGHPIYSSSGMIRIEPTLPKILYSIDQNSLMPMFEAFVATQAALIRSQRVIDMAMESATWREIGGDTTSDLAKQSFENSLKVAPSQGGLVNVSFEDRDSRRAVAGAKSVVDAYRVLYVERDTKEAAQRLQVLEDRRTALNSQIKGLRDRIVGIAEEFGSDSLETTYQAKLDDLKRLEAILGETQLAMANLSPNKVDSPKESLTPAEIAVFDPQMRQLIGQQSEYEIRLAALKQKFGVNHPQVMAISGALNETKESIARMTREYAEGNRKDPTVIPVDTSTQNIERLKAREKSLSELVAATRKQVLDLGRKNMQINSLKQEMETANQSLKETTGRLEQLNVESAAGGRISVISSGDNPLAPVKDPRRQYAVLGGFLGMSCGLGIFLVIGLLDRRLRSSQEGLTDRFGTRMLGILPQLPEDVGDEEQAAVTANCVHHIRLTLDLILRNANQKTIAITSAASGSGKTSLAISLGLSFAAAGSRTLLIDADTVGARLTARMDVAIRRRIGDILVAKSLVTPEQRDKALIAAERTGKRLGETLIALGYLTSEQIRDSLRLQEKNTIGLMEAINGQPPETCMAASGLTNLTVLPMSSAGRSSYVGIAPQAFDALLTYLRPRFDVILVDTGPVPGSVDSSAVVARTDATVMVMARGEDRTQIERSATLFANMGANLVGVVYNRATIDDVAMSPYSSPASSMLAESGTGNGGKSPNRTLRQKSRIGPMASVVAPPNSPDEGD